MITIARQNNEREDLTAIPHPKCVCGHPDDMHYASSDEAKGFQAKPTHANTNYGFGCKMHVTKRDGKGRPNGGSNCACRKYENAT